MNRAQRRKAAKAKGVASPKPVIKFPEIHRRSRQSVPEDLTPDFSAVPLATMCQTIQLLINELFERGYPIYDFDNKSKSIQQIQIMQGKVFFLAAEEADHE